MRRLMAALLVIVLGVYLCGCGGSKANTITIASKFFTEQVVLAELLAQHIEARTGIKVARKSNLGGTLLVQQALLSGAIDLYVEYTGTALTAVLKEKPVNSDPKTTYLRVKQQYDERFHLAVMEPLGFENNFAMVVRSDDAKNFHLQKLSDVIPLSPKWKIGVGYEFLERPDGFPGLAKAYDLHFSEEPTVLDLGLLYRALVTRQVDIVAGNSTDGAIEALKLVPLVDDRHYFPPYDAVPIVRQDTLAKYPALRGALDELAGKVSGEDIRHLNAQVDVDQRDPAAVVRAFREARGL
jgi:osmoprotectant transport system substrate-binding protein